jgi:hypothetical protein
LEEYEQDNWTLKTELQACKDELEATKLLSATYRKEQDILKSLSMAERNDVHCDTAKLLTKWQINCDILDQKLQKSQAMYEKVLAEKSNLQSRLADLNLLGMANNDENQLSIISSKISEFENHLLDVELRNRQLKQTINMLRSLFTKSGGSVALFDAHRYIADFQVQLKDVTTKLKCSILERNEQQSKFETELKLVVEQRDAALLCIDVHNDDQSVIVDTIKQKLHEVSSDNRIIISDQCHFIESLKRENESLKIENEHLVASLKCEEDSGMISVSYFDFQKLNDEIDNAALFIRRLKLEVKNRDDEISKYEIKSALIGRQCESIEKETTNLVESNAYSGRQAFEFTRGVDKLKISGENEVKLPKDLDEALEMIKRLETQVSELNNQLQAITTKISQNDKSNFEIQSNINVERTRVFNELKNHASQLQNELLLLLLLCNEKLKISEDQLRIVKFELDAVKSRTPFNDDILEDLERSWYKLVKDDGIIITKTETLKF